MAMLTNRLAPGLSGELSPAAARRVAEIRAAGGTSPFATTDSSVIRRDSSHDQASLLRPAFVRDSEKVIHTPAYNRLNGKTQVFSFAANDDITRRNLHEQLVGRVARDIGEVEIGRASCRERV